MKYISHASGFISIIVLFLYISSVTICGENPFIKLSWPLMHLVFALFTILILYELDFLRPEVYTPFKHILDYIVTEKT